MATDATNHRLRRPAASVSVAHRLVRPTDHAGRTPHTSSPSEEFSYV